MTKEINSLVLAYLGDTIYEDYIREYLIKKGIGSIKELQEASMDYVSAKSQARILEEVINKNVCNDEELDIIKRARNNNSKHHPKSCDVITYRKATGLEALIGYLKLESNKERIDEIMNIILSN